MPTPNIIDIFSRRPCLCGSGIKARRCCMNGGVYRPRLDTGAAPQSPSTGVAVAGCYAAALSDCDGALEKEHPISDSVLGLMDSIDVSGLRGQKPGETKRRGAKALASRILCARHNRLLSSEGVDAAGKSFVESLRRIFDPDRFGTFASMDITRVVDVDGYSLHAALFNGALVSRWVHKATLGMLSSRMAELSESRATRLREWSPPITLLRHIFHGAPPGEIVSMQVLPREPDFPAGTGAVRMNFIWDSETEDPLGCALQLHTIPLLAAWAPVTHFNDELIDQAMRWLGLIEVHHPRGVAMIWLSWPHGWTNAISHLRLRLTADVAVHTATGTTNGRSAET